MNSTEIQTAVPKKKQRPSFFSSFGKDKRGSTAIEFALLIFPFTLLMFAVIETGISFGTQQLMSNVMDDVSRSLRVGDIRPEAVTATSIKTLICNGIKTFVAAGCPDLVVDLRTYSSFAAVPLTIAYKVDGDIDTAGFAVTPGGALTINQIRVFYRWKIKTDLIRKYLATMPGGKTLLFTTLTWRNEPYDT
jgi:Flp pilus assembly protein TadG